MAGLSDLLKTVIETPWYGHELLFPHRRTEATSPAHLEALADWHSPHPRVITMAFRGFAKSTLAEEAIAIMGATGQFKNCLIVGENEQRACERLRAIKHEIEFNENLQDLFEVAPGDVWQETKAILSNGVIIQAYGRGQSLRGAKHLDVRPDLVFCDDLEDDESVATEAGREKTLKWMTSTVMPALAPGGRIRMAATPLHPEALVPTLAQQPSWLVHTYPIEHRGPGGERVATWPERFSLEAIDKIREDYQRLGMTQAFSQEYMCEAVDLATRAFKASEIRVVPRERKAWWPVYAMYDPARTTHLKSATTGWAAWSWVNDKLVVWDAGASRWTPSEIIDHITQLADEMNPVFIGIEETGLNEWVREPLRQRASRVGGALPILPVNAPKGKLDFIRGLQPFFQAGDVSFAKDLPELRAQLLGFPNGAIDAPNALAYALRMRPGAVVYEGFSEDCIVEKAETRKGPYYMAINARRGVVAAALVQVVRGRLTVFVDWVAEGEIGELVPDMLAEARLWSGRAFDCIAPPSHFTTFDRVGLKGVLTRAKEKARAGGDILKGREEMRALIRKRVSGEPGLHVVEKAAWTARALAGGYCRSFKDGRIAETPDDTTYAVLMEALESFCALFVSRAENVDNEPNYAYTQKGTRYLTALVR